MDDPVQLKAGTAVAFGEVTADAAGYGLVAGNAKIEYDTSDVVKLDLWLDRVSADDQTCYQSHTIPKGHDMFYLWPMWMGELDDGETYRWYVRLESGASGTLTVRYAKGTILPGVAP